MAPFRGNECQLGQGVQDCPSPVNFSIPTWRLWSTGDGLYHPEVDTAIKVRGPVRSLQERRSFCEQNLQNVLLHTP